MERHEVLTRQDTPPLGMDTELLQDISIVNNRKEVFSVSLFHAAMAGFRDPD
jgi:hypothetical protein